MKKTLEMSLIAIFVLSGFLYGLEMRTGDAVDIPADQVINDDLIAFGRQVSIKGKVDGDVMVFAQTIIIEGEVSGTVIAGGSLVNVLTKRCRSVWAAGNSIQISGLIANNAVILGNTLFADKNAKIGKDLIAFGKQLNMSAEVANQVKGGVAEFFMIGKSGSVDISADESQVASMAQVDGDFIVRGNKEPMIAPDAKITGQIRFIKGEEPARNKSRAGFPLFRIYLLIASFVTGVIIIVISSRHARRIMDTLTRTPWKTAGFGFVCVFGVPVAVIFVIAMLITIPVAFYSIFMYLTVLYLSSIFVGLVIGEQIIRLFKKEGTVSLYLSLLVGMVILFAVGFIPVLGFVVSFLTLIIGAGMVVTGQLNLIQEAKQKEIL